MAQRRGTPKVWPLPAIGIGPYAPRGDEGRHAGSSCPTGGCGEPPRLPWVAAHSGAFAARMGGMGRERSRDHPQSAQQPRTIPQSRLRRASSLCTREPLGTGDADCRVGPLGLLAMTMVFCHSEERSDVGIRFFTMDGGRGFGPPRSSAPTKRRDSCRNHPSQRRTAERLRQRVRGASGNRRRGHQKGALPRDRPSSA